MNYMGEKSRVKLETARKLRTKETFAEKCLWSKLRNRKYGDVKFRRQHIIRGFVLDFFSPKCRLGIEVDGEVHDKQKDYDEARQAVIEGYGVKILRFSNKDIKNNMEFVLNIIEKNLKKEKGKDGVLPLHDNGEGVRG